MSVTNIERSFFDTVHERKGTNSLKYDFAAANAKSQDLIPMWIADMDFQSPPPVITRLQQLAQHGIFGYTSTYTDYDNALISWYQRRMNWTISPETILKAPGVIFIIAAALRCLTEPGDNILICQPVYHPFAKIIEANNRRCVVSQLKLENSHYQMDFADIENKIRTNDVKLFILCSPHNPVGRVWTLEELNQISEICLKHGVYIIADEIHSDFIYHGHHHIPLASLNPEIAQRTVTCLAPTKTFNLAGLQAAHAVVDNPQIREKLQKACLATGYSHLNAMATAACQTAYQAGEPWFDTLLTYLEQNIKLLAGALAEQNKISLIPPEGTYLMWLDCRKLQLSDAQLDDFFLNQAGLWLNNGSIFGKGGSGFMRLNIACPQSILQTAVNRLRHALNNQ